ncbi:TIGR04222 domain-containing membrane protein [Rhodococcoides yunnanense]|uniref:TIGR04222 domain-containing membrane protein n=1 Tax=Rhodococcoides yunnanense TaxID=278209 RepID=A0ABU4B8G8_9NOCA|nr:TIGR04222 domain-containing membrane protein [Rhodococcus yunnanensis]MDV6260481.1 TIGR04222 domain-containing membrane protein [Rhodococcus yunnanensis]
MGNTDTWGIASAEFLRWYLLAAVLAVAATLVGNWLDAHRTVAASPTGRVLTPPEVGLLTNDEQAVMASLAILRGGNVIDSSGRARRGLTDTERVQLDWFTRTVLERLGTGKAPLVRSRLVSNMSGACAQLRSALVDEGLMHGANARPMLARMFPILFVAAVGIARIAAGIANEKPVGFLIVIVVLLHVALPFVIRRPRRTAPGNEALRRLRAENNYLEPRARPSFTAYGPSRAGMSAALFGAGALMVLDPAMAGALSYGSAHAGGAASFGLGGDSGGGGDSGDGGGGGGGCGGGGCGG